MTYNPQLHHRKSIRLKGVDYSKEGVYFITICTNEMECLFGEIINGEMILNSFGKIVKEEIAKTSQIREWIEISYYVVMPNHIHFLLEILYRDENVEIGNRPKHIGDQQPPRHCRNLPLHRRERHRNTKAKGNA